MTAGSLPAGKALPIAAATLTVAGQELSRKTAPADSTAPCRVTLKGEARTNLHAWFQDTAGQDVCGAYYATVRRV